MSIMDLEKVVSQARKAAQGSHTPCGPITWVWGKEDLKALVKAIHASQKVVMDLETTGLDEYAEAGGDTNGGYPARIVLASLTLPNAERAAAGAYDWRTFDGEQPMTYLVPLSHPASPLLGAWRKVMAIIGREINRSGKPFVNANIKFDARWVFAQAGVDLSDRIEWDTTVSSQLVDTEARTRLKIRAARDFGIEEWDDFDLSTPGAAEQVDLIQLGEYAARDTYYTWKIEEEHREQMFLTGDEEPFDSDDIQMARLGKVATYVSMPTVKTLTKVEQRGFLLDVDWVHAKIEEMDALRLRACEDILGLYGTAPAPAPAKDGVTTAATSKWFQGFVAQAIEAGDLRVTARTDSGNAQWNKAVLIAQQRQGSPAADALLRHRDATKTLEFLRSWLELRDPNNVIHATYNVGFVKTGRLSSSTPNMQQCLQGADEVLTRSGWTRLDELKPGIEIMQVSETGGGSWVVPTGYVNKPYAGNMVRMKSDWIDVLMTPDHRLLTLTRGDAPRWERAAQWVGTDGKVVDRKFIRALTTSPDAPSLTEDERLEMRTAIAMQADGSSDGNFWQATVCKKRKGEALIELGGDRRQWKAGTRYVLRARKDSLSRWLDPVTKNFRPEPFLALNREDCAWALDEILRWDGDSVRGCTYTQSQTRRASVDLVQALAALCGRSTTLYAKRVDGVTYPTANLHRKAVRYASRMWVTEEAYDGRVYCVSVPSGAFLARSGGTVWVTGNCSARLKPAFIPRPGHVLLDLDYSQVELRVAAFISRSQPMIEAFQRGDDLHRLLAAKIAGKAPEDVTSLERKRAKAGNFGLLYGMSPGGFQSYAATAYDVSLTLAEAQAVHSAFFEMWDGMRQWHEKAKRRAYERGYVTSPIGRTQWLSDLYSKSSFKSSHAERNALNSPVQGFGSDLMQMAAASIMGTLPGYPLPKVEGAHVVATVHDEICIEVPEDRWQEILVECKRRMEDVNTFLRPLDCQMDVPIVAGPSAGTRWGVHDLHDEDDPLPQV
jgi:DNA-directed DNA polymerase|nr:MAG TPA: DNA polymerase [Caudoviricetes sp.]